MVVSIVALLIALLLPALSQARAVARLAQCGSTIRQLNLGLMMYANQSRDVLPAVSHKPNPDADPVHTWRNYIDPYLASERTFKCPANAARTRTSNNDTALDGTAKNHPRSYHANGNTIANPVGQPAPMATFRPLVTIRSPSQMILITEGTGEGAGPLTNHPYPADLSTQYDIDRIRRCFFIHKTNTANFSFADGSTRAMRLIDTGQPRNLWTLNQHNNVAPAAWLNKLTQAEWISYPQ